MWEDILRLGGLEIINTARVAALTQAEGIPVGIHCGDCSSIPDLLSSVYAENGEMSDVTTAPWYDEDDPTSEDFFGVVGQRIRDVMSSMREVPVSQRLGSGGVLGRERDTTRDVRATVLMVARNARGIDYGVNWLSSALSRNSCGQHSNKCGLSDLEWLVDCPSDRAVGQSEADYVAEVAPLRRLLHDVATTSGPTVLEEREDDCYVIYEVEFTITAQEPKVFGVPKVFELEPDYITGKSDIARNLIRNPSAEPYSDLFTVRQATNFVRNPSFEVSTSFWTWRREFVSGDNSGFPDVSIARRANSSGLPWVVGGFYGELRVETMPLSRLTLFDVFATGTSFVGSESPSLIGKPVRFGGSIFKTEDSLEAWIRIVALDTGGGELGRMETERFTSPSGYTDLVSSESFIPPAGTSNLVLHVGMRVAGESTLPSATLAFDALWISEG